MPEKNICPSCGAEIAPDGTATFSLETTRTREAELEKRIAELEAIILQLEEKAKSVTEATNIGNEEIPFVY